MKTGLQKLSAQNEKGKFICVGLDTDMNKIPAHLKSGSNPVMEFNKIIIENTSEFSAAFKINFAFYEKEGEKGFRNLFDTISLIPKNILIIGDAKRGDIGNTSRMYAESIFNYFKCDASTLHPYMGEDSIRPFLEDETKLNFILALTSNPSANDFEKLRLEDNKYLYQKVIEKTHEWNSKKNCGIVFGATKVDDLKENIELINDLPVLLPGVGAQGGSLEESAKVFFNKRRKNFLINVSRGIIYKSSGKDFGLAAKNEIIFLNESIKKLND